jgi:formylglycine-generating enzyme required for sulfatase activity
LSCVEPERRRHVGLLAGELGWVPEDLDAWVEIPPGPFLYDDDKETREISRTYWIGKYPVTNLQFARFIAAGAYVSRELWSEAGWAWREEHSVSEPGYWRDSERRSLLCPVVGVSWHEAEAYCRWMTRDGIGQGLGLEGHCSAGERSGWLVRLPTELEWERAARGTDGAVYPWGDDEPSVDLANYAELAGGTTAVGTYPAGYARGGVADLAGNTWEWCSGEAGADRVIRGGSWLGDARDGRSAVRAGLVPDFRDDSVGFRCVRVEAP